MITDEYVSKEIDIKLIEFDARMNEYHFAIRSGGIKGIWAEVNMRIVTELVYVHADKEGWKYPTGLGRKIFMQLAGLIAKGTNMKTINNDREFNWMVGLHAVDDATIEALNTIYTDRVGRKLY